MLGMIKDWMGIGDKVLLNGVIHGISTPETIRDLERFMRTYNMPGQLRVAGPRTMEFVLEGPRSKLERLLVELPHQRAMRGQVLQVAWGEYKGKFHGFRVSL